MCAAGQEVQRPTRNGQEMFGTWMRWTERAPIGAGPACPAKIRPGPTGRGSTRHSSRAVSVLAARQSTRRRTHTRTSASSHGHPDMHYHVEPQGPATRPTALRDNCDSVFLPFRPCAASYTVIPHPIRPAPTTSRTHTSHTHHISPAPHHYTVHTTTATSSPT